MKIKTETQTGSIVSFKYDDEIAEITGLTTSFEPSQEGTPWMAPTVDTAPYLLRQSPDFDHEYNSEIDTLVGGTIAWNQLVQNGSFAEKSNWNEVGASYTTSNNICSFVSSSNWGRIMQEIKQVVGHKYLIHGEIKNANTTTNARIFVGKSDTGDGKGFMLSTIGSTDWYSGTKVFECTDASAKYMFAGSNNVTASFQFRNIFCIDLTATFGTEIADYVYGLEQSTAGSGIAWLKSYGFLTKNYYAYNDGSLVSVKTSEHRTTGKNLLPITVDGLKSLNSAGTWSGNECVFRGLTFIILTNEDGEVTGIEVNGTASLQTEFTLFRDTTRSYPWNGCKLNGTPTGGSGSTFDVRVSDLLVRSNACYGDDVVTNLTETGQWQSTIMVRQGYTVQNLVFKPMLRFADTDSTYEPYESHSYPLGNDDLRGLFKLSNGNLYADGDVKTSDGKIQRKYSALLDLGTFTWSTPIVAGTQVKAFTQASIGGARTYGNAEMPNIIANGYVTDTPNHVWSGANKCIAINSGGYIQIYDTAFTDYTGEQVKAALSGVYLICEKATPTTETADSFASPQIVSPNGTEEYVDERSVPVPVGHKTTYMLPYSISGWDEVKAYVSPTEEEEDATIYTINLNGTRYGGDIDFFSGVMTLNMVDVDLGSLNWDYESGNGRFHATINGIKQASSARVTKLYCSRYECLYNSEPFSPNLNGVVYTGSGVNLYVHDHSYTDATSFKANANGVQLVYPLADPIEVQLTAQQIEALQGQNYVWCDSGDTTLTWRHIPVLDEAVMLNGKYLELTIDGYSTLGTSGRRSLGRQLDTYSVGTADGETVKNSVFPSRKITVNYVIQTDTEDELTEAINQLANILNQDECDFVFRDEPDKFFSGYGLLDSEPKKYRHAVKGTWSLYCAYPFKRSNKLVELSSKDPTVASVDAHSATFVFDYNGTLPAHPILRAEFASAKSGGEYNEDGDCGYVAFLDAEENIIQLGNPEVLDVDQYANATLINREFTSLSGWTASGVTVGDLTDQFWQNGKGQTQSYAKGTGSFTKSVGNGAINMEFDIVHRLCVSAANQTGAFECYAKNGNTIVVGFKIEKTGSGTTGVVSYILNNKVVGTDSIDLSYYNTHFGYCNRSAVYGTEYYSVYEKYYVKKKGKKKKKYHWVTYPRTVQTGWSYTQSNLNSGWTKDGSVIVFSIGNLADRTFKNSDVELTPSTSIVFNISGSFHTNAVHSCAMLSKAGVPFAEIPNVFTAGDVVEGDCNSADVMLYRAGSLEGHLEPQYGALGNDWEDFEIKPGKNIIRAVWSDWVNTSYKPEIKIIFNEVYV